MLVKTKGIILRSIKYGESSLILDIYTQGHGLNSYIVSGIRNKKSKVKVGTLQLMSIVEIVAYHKKAKGLFRIKEVNIERLYQRIPFDIKRSSVGIFMIEIIRNAIREDEEENQQLYNFLEDWFIFLDATTEAVSNLHLLFLIELAQYIGFQPRDNFSLKRTFFDLQEGQFIAQSPEHQYYMDPPEAELLYDFIMQEREYVHELKCSNTERRKLLDMLILFYKLHIDTIKTLHTYKILNEILA
jgi:DNA repair protein RecO (recombination protein O)